eukprot:NODE_604_length_1509_cov_46.637671_g445_i0.p1 GENE.NODE_604_length_1509_cov_46.637671_g445_i0~~NODE_604_length_1509_cov_46.637671_g445_i0.p1  ORF type:complete len:264 (+),score=35.13 NODE_604_length_1509_cov_46.637671_g445_i0:100-891(+)
MPKGKSQGGKRAAGAEPTKTGPSGRTGSKPRHGPQEPVVELEAEPISTLSFWPPGAQEANANPTLEFQLALQRVQLLKDNVYLIPNALTSAECAAWVGFAEARGFLEAKHAASASIALRDNGRLAIWAPELAATLFQRLRGALFPDVDGRQLAGLSANIRLYRYVPGQRFGKHYDESCEEDGATSQLTLLLYLSDSGSEQGQGLEGGETKFYAGTSGKKELVSVPPQLGAGLLHYHGARCLLHEGAPVRAGVKYLFRTDVLYM